MQKNGQNIQKCKILGKLKKTEEKKMRKSLKKVVAMLGIACMLTSATACQPKFDAAGYVKSYADSNYKGEFEKYAEICKVDASEPEKLYNQNIETMVSTFSAGAELDDEMKEKFTQLAKDMLAKVKYTVDEDVEYKDGEFTVKVNAERLNLVIDTNEALEYGQKVGKEAAEEYLKTHKKIDQTEYTEYLQDKMVEALYEYFSDVVEKATYDKEETVEITIAKNSEGLYAMSTSESAELDSALMNASN